MRAATRKRHRVSVQFPRALKQDLKREASRRGQSLTNYVLEAVLRAYRENRKYPGGVIED